MESTKITRQIDGELNGWHKNNSPCQCMEEKLSSQHKNNSYSHVLGDS